MEITMIKTLDINKLINNNYKFYAHKKGEGNKHYETLQEHSELSLKYFDKLYFAKLSNVFYTIKNEFLKDCGNEASDLFEDLVLNTIYLHDIGKVNPVFQKIKMENNLCMKIGLGNYSNHSMLSAIIYLSLFIEKLDDIKNDKEYNVLKDILLINFYLITKHHSSLNYFYDCSNLEKENTKSILKILENGSIKNLLNINLISVDLLKNFLKDYYNIESKIDINNTYYYIYSKLMMSILFACDYYATYEFMNGTEVSDIGVIEDISEIYKTYKNGDIYKSIKKYELIRDKYKTFESVDDINILRSEMFLECEENLIQNFDANIYYL